MSAYTITLLLSWALILVGVWAMCAVAKRVDDQAHQALDDHEVADRLRPSGSVTEIAPLRAPHPDPIVRLMHEGLSADDAVARAVQDSTGGLA